MANNRLPLSANESFAFNARAAEPESPWRGRDEGKHFLSSLKTESSLKQRTRALTSLGDSAAIADRSQRRLDFQATLADSPADRRSETFPTRQCPVSRYLNVGRGAERQSETRISAQSDERRSERTFEAERETRTERIVELPFERKRYVERPIERQIAVPYNVRVEREVVDERVIDVSESEAFRYPHFERLPTQTDYVHRQNIKEIPIIRENEIEREIRVPREVRYEVPVERTREKRIPILIDRPVAVEKLIEEEVVVPVERTLYRPVEYNVERPVIRERVVEKPIPVEVLVEREVAVPVERLVEREVPFERVVPREVETLVEIPKPIDRFHELEVERRTIREVSVEAITPRPTPKTIRKPSVCVTPREVSVERVREVLVPKTVERTIEKRVPRVRQKPIEIVIEKEVLVERIVERPREVERVVEVAVERLIDNPIVVERVVEREVAYDVVVEREVEVVVVRDVEVSVPRLIEVDVEVLVERPIYREVEVVEEYEVEANRVLCESAAAEEFNCEIEDGELAHAIDARRRELSEEESLNEILRTERESLGAELRTLQFWAKSAETLENADLIIAHANLCAELEFRRQNSDEKRRAREKRPRNSETVLNRNPRGDELTKRMFALIEANRELVAEAKCAAAFN